MQFVFLSYASRNQLQIDKIVDELQAKGICCLLDRPGALPGQNWKRVLRTALRRGVHFLACFSNDVDCSSEDGMHEELDFAIDELCRHPLNRAWFIPIRLSDCTIPNRSIGKGETLRSLEWIALSDDWLAGIAQIASIVQRTPASSTSPIDASFSLDYAMALKRLDDARLAHRIHGIVALEQVARLSRLGHWPIMQTIAAFVRNRSPHEFPYSYEELFFQRPPDDILVALNAIRTREANRTEEGLDFSKSFLAETDFSHGNYPNANFGKAILIEATFEGADIRAANFNHARMELANLRHVFGPKVCLSGANLECANLDNAVLCGADMTDASLNNARFCAADLSRVQFCGASLEGADFSGSDLTGVSFMGANLKGAVFNEAELRKMSWGNAILPETLQTVDEQNV